MSIADAYAQAVDTLDLSQADTAVVALGRRLAEDIDTKGTDKVAGQFLAVLDALGLTPKARKSITKDQPSGEHQSKLDELRSRRVRRAQGVDATAPATHT